MLLYIHKKLIKNYKIGRQQIDSSKHPVDCQWSAWVESPCSATCQPRNKEFDNVYQVKLRMEEMKAKNGGKNCSGNYIEYIPCSLEDCPCKLP